MVRQKRLDWIHDVMLTAFAIVMLGAFAALVQATRKAVTGYEDIFGFHEDAKPEAGP